MKTLILCGGLGLRIKGSFDDVPKPLIAVQGRPLLAFILDGYVASGFRDFVLLVGQGESLFRDFASTEAGAGVSIEVLPTGLDTPTGGRLKRALPLLTGEDRVFVTYGDGISNVDFGELLRVHRASGRGATLTAVRPQLPFGLLEVDNDGAVSSFLEKPVMSQYTNGGFFVLEREILAALSDDSDFETGTLPDLARRGELGAYLHPGFWKNMDTYKDYMSLSTIDIAERMRR